MKISYFNALTDNYIWFIQKDKDLIIIDPSEAAPIMRYLAEHQLQLKAMLLTHDHWDHVGGLEELTQKQVIPTYGQCCFTNQHEKHFVLSENISIEMIETPGHTEKSVCFHVTYHQEQHLFCGDTLFSAGCGRVFTGDYAAMFSSLNKLKALDGTCWVYPGHEYTLKNLAFAEWLEPNNILIQQQINKTRKQWEKQHCTVPSQLSTEKNINPFFRCDDPSMVAAVSAKVGKPVSPGLDCFMHLRQLKDSF